MTVTINSNYFGENNRLVCLHNTAPNAWEPNLYTDTTLRNNKLHYFKLMQLSKKIILRTFL